MTSGKTVKIGKYEVGNVWLAPMAGYTDIAFRELCKSYGAGLTVTEMVSARGLKYDSGASSVIARVSEIETPSCVQLFGSTPEDFVIAAQKIECDIIDINMGCPMPKIVKNGDGSALLKSPKLAGEIVRALANSTDRPITVKTRLGYAMGENGAAELVERVAEAGAAAVTIHGRYAEQRYTGNAEFSEIKKIAERSTIPILINGDITDPTAAIKPPYAGAAIGRAALENPCIFGGGVCDNKQVALKHIELLLKYFDERYTINQARKFFVHYFKGARGGKALRAAVNAATTVSEVLSALENMS